MISLQKKALANPSAPHLPVEAGSDLYSRQRIGSHISAKEGALVKDTLSPEIFVMKRSA